MKKNELLRFYQKLESSFLIKNGNLSSATYSNVDSNFNYSSAFGRHRWFNYKEGFSPVLVQKIFDEYHLTDRDVVCDPFCGAGTTLCVAKGRGMTSYGFEVNPFASFISEVKGATYSENDIAVFKQYISELNKLSLAENIPLPDNEYLCRLFDSKMMRVQLNIRKYIYSLEKSRSSNLLRFAWLCTLEECSLFRKAGNGLKKRKNGINYRGMEQKDFALACINERSNVILEDYREGQGLKEPKIFTESANDIETRIPSSSLDLILFSPPYANCFDYTKIYYLELWFGGFISNTAEQKAIRMESVRSHVHATWPERYSEFHLKSLNEELIPLISEQKLWSDRIPIMLNGYFADMENFLKHAFVCLKKGGHCAIVVSNSAYAGIVVPTDLLLAQIGERLGFAVEEIEVKRLIITSSQQYKETEYIRQYLRESVVKLVK